MQRFHSAFQEFEVPSVMCDLTVLPVEIRLAYQTTQNFMGQNLYGNFSTAFVHEIGFQKLSRAYETLQVSHPELTFVIFDGLRPRHIQRKMYDFVEPLGQAAYVAHPDSGSLHNFGLAIDLSLFNRKTNLILDLGTEFDDFSDLAHTYNEEELVQTGRLSALQLTYRNLLRSVMLTSGFLSIRHEWWHFNVCSLAEAKALVSIVE